MTTYPPGPGGSTNNITICLQVGIVAWGLDCGQKNVPGAYASVIRGLCFIKWALECEHNSKYHEFVPFSQDCEFLIEDEILEIISKRESLSAGNEIIVQITVV